MTDLSGQSVGRYHFFERLGEGGMATVYKAYDTRLERDVAIKVIRKDAFPPETLGEVLKRFEREAKALARLSHPNIVKVHDYGEYEGSPYLVMEYLPGGTLKKMLGKSMPWDDVIRLLLPIANGVAHAHQHGILHRDIKPANILITEGGEPMLTDFGIARILEGNQNTALTASGMLMGTPEYMSPEQWTGVTSPQSDMYSLGIVLYEMMTGRKPYIADTPGAILLKQVSESMPLPSKFVDGLPVSVERFLIKVLAKDPENRYEDLNAMSKAMENLLETQARLAPPQPVMRDRAAVLEKSISAEPPKQGLPVRKPQSSSKGKRAAWFLSISIITACIFGVGMIGVFYLWVSSVTPSNEINGTILTSTKPLIPTPTHATAIRESLNVVLYDGHALQTFSDKPDVIAYANIQEFPPPEGVTILSNCTETTCWRSSQFLALRSPGTFLEASGPVTAEVGVQFWGDTNDGLCRVLVDGQEVWKGDTYGTDVNWPGGAFVKYLYISGLSLEAHTIRVEFVGPGDVTIRYFGFGPVAL